MNNEGADQTARMLFAFVVLMLESVCFFLATKPISRDEANIAWFRVTRPILRGIYMKLIIKVMYFEMLFSVFDKRKILYI